MKNLLISLFIICGTLILISDVKAQSRPGNTELGIILGEPTGISFKFWQSRSTAIDAAVAWSFGRNESVHLHASYLIHNNLDVNSGVLHFYYGIGARTLFRDDPEFGARIPIGLQYIFPSTRLTMFFEVAPTMDLIPSTSFGVNGGIGARYFL
jgi:hypothetical protein